ncbi:hypothetical protein DRO54_11365 [Candidatus Bathyarchaeota archaeon]|nr:MAG: hypothetical protein DRO54_11365 [Candidatus Bathyarchaeota archaeon]
MMQRDIKRFLAYSSIANMGYILTGIGIAAHVLRNYPDSAGVAALAMIGSLFHILNHALGKGLSFLCSGCYIIRAKTRDIAELEGLGSYMPLTTTSFGIGLLTLAGVPPLSGFWSKLFIASAGLSIPADIYMLTATMIFIANSILADGYYLWLFQRITFGKPREIGSKIRDAPVIMLAPLIGLAAICILVTIMLGPTLELIRSAVEVILG